MSSFKLYISRSEFQAAGAEYEKQYDPSSEPTLGTFNKYKSLEPNPQLLWVLELKSHKYWGSRCKMSC